MRSFLLWKMRQVDKLSIQSHQEVLEQNDYLGNAATASELSL
jgi:hypothetical protein